MNPLDFVQKEVHRRRTHGSYRTTWQRFHIDAHLLLALLCLIGLGLTILFSASNNNSNLLIRQAMRMGIAFGVLVFFAQIKPERFKAWTPYIYILTITLLLAVLVIGKIGKGAQRWLDLGVFRFQPSELMKLALPMCVAWYLSDKSLPPSPRQLLFAGLIILVPALLTAKQPDLGTALMLVIAGATVLLFAGMGWRYIVGLLVSAAAFAPILWHFMHNYQRQRVLTFLNPEHDPLGAGYHIIQSKIAIGSGGVFGKGWLNGTQSHLHFLPEHTTDFIFAVCGEELGLIGGIILLSIYVWIVGRVLYLATDAQDTFSRLVISSFGLTFFFSAFVNIGMVTGILPVVGLPLPLVSYGGTSMVSLMAMAGIIMAMGTRRKLVGT